MKYISNRRRVWIINIYIFAIVLWFLLILIMGIYSYQASIILWLAPIVFLISMTGCTLIDQNTEDEIFTTSFFGIGLLVAISILGWMKEIKGVEPRMIGVLLLAMLFSLLPHIDLWLPKKWQSVYKHVKSVFQTYSVVLFAFVLLEFLFREVNYKGEKSMDERGNTFSSSRSESPTSFFE